MTSPAGQDLFEEQRPRLLGLAYRMLASRVDSEDVVQEAWLRWSRADRAAIANPPGWLTTVTTRLALDRQRDVSRRRESYVGPWLPEPVSTAMAPEDHVELAESLTLGFLVVLDELAPVERAVLLLADVFEESYSVIASSVGKSEQACRQIASRARRKVRGGESQRLSLKPSSSGSARAELLGELLAAIAAGEEATVVRLLDPDVVMVSDGGPRQRAARYPVVGVRRVTRLLINLAARAEVVSIRVESYNSAPALVLDTDLGLVVVSGEARDGRVTRLWFLLNPEKLTALDAPTSIL